MLDWVMEERSPDSAKAAVGGDAKRKKRFQGRAGSVAQSKNGGEQGEAPRDNASARDATATADAFGFGVLFFGVSSAQTRKNVKIRALQFHRSVKQPEWERGVLSWAGDSMGPSRSGS